MNRYSSLLAPQIAAESIDPGRRAKQDLTQRTATIVKSGNGIIYPTSRAPLHAMFARATVTHFDIRIRLLAQQRCHNKPLDYTHNLFNSSFGSALRRLNTRSNVNTKSDNEVTQRASMRTRDLAAPYRIATRREPPGRVSHPPRRRTTPAGATTAAAVRATMAPLGTEARAGNNNNCGNNHNPRSTKSNTGSNTFDWLEDAALTTHSVIYVPFDRGP